MKKVVIIIFIIEIIIPLLIGFVFLLDRDELILTGYSHKIIFYQDLGRDSMEFYLYPYSQKDNIKFVQNENYKIINEENLEIVKKYIGHFPGSEYRLDFDNINKGDYYHLITKHTEDEEKFDNFTIYFYDMDLSELYYFNYVV